MHKRKRQQTRGSDGLNEGGDGGTWSARKYASEMKTSSSPKEPWPMAEADSEFTGALYKVGVPMGFFLPLFCTCLESL